MPLITYSEKEKPRFRPHSIKQEMRKLTTPIRLDGNVVTRYVAPVIAEYLDVENNRIVPTAVLKNHREVWPTMHFSERAMQREFILTSLRKEVREFAEFVLAFRNKRRGVTPCVDRLTRWYAQLTGKQACHVRRYLKPLEEAGVLAGDSLLGPLFQIAGNNVTAREHLAEDFQASCKFMFMRIKRKAADQIEDRSEHALPNERAQERVAMTGMNRSTVLEFVRSLFSAGKLQPQFL